MWSTLSTFASTVASTAKSTLSTLEETARQAASDLEQQHRLTVEAKRSAGDKEEDLIPTEVPEAVKKQLSQLRDLVAPALGGVSGGGGGVVAAAASEKEGGQAETVQPVATIFTASNVAVLPWEVVGAHAGARDELRAQVLALAQDKRNFLVPPPEGTDFVFDMGRYLPTALAILKVDSALEQMRFDLVPKQVKDEVFWQNYFYRVNMLQQSCMLSVGVDSMAIAAAAGDGMVNEEAVGGAVVGAGLGEGAAVLAAGRISADFVPVGVVENAGEAVTSSKEEIPDSLEDADGLAGEEYVSSESFGADWEKELQDELEDV